MSNIEILRGAAVRDQRGTKGRVLAISEPTLRVGWYRDPSVSMREEELHRGDTRLESEIEVLTLGNGWVPLGSIFQRRSVFSQEKLEALHTKMQGRIEKIRKLRSDPRDG